MRLVNPYRWLRRKFRRKRKPSKPIGRITSITEDASGIHITGTLFEGWEIP